MRRIDKSKILSTKYKKWLDKLNHDKKKHPPKSDTYYKDVVMNLLYCQKGLCAYTEMLLCAPGLITEKNWENGRYKPKNPGRFGQLEHFNPKQKENKYWEWGNLFVIHSRVNLLKSDQEVDDILKPDSTKYDPLELLEYKRGSHIFRPHSKITDEKLIQRIRRMICLLQLNNETIRYERETFLEKVTAYIEVGRSFEIDRFFTACQMTGLLNQKG
jgi:hypothetical protein